MSTLKLTSQRHGSDHVVALRGELDIVSSPQVEAELKRLEATDATTIALDLSGLDFIDSSGLHILMAARERCRESPDRLLLQRPSARVRKVVAMAGLADVLPFAD